MPSELLALAAPHVGEPPEVADLSQSHGESSVWRVSGPLGTVALKAHRQGRKFHQELSAYRDWLPRLAGPPGVRVPRLLAHGERHPRALVVSWEAGEVIENASIGRRAALALHRSAGAFLRALHDLPYADEDPVTPRAAYAARLEAWSERARGVVPSSVTANVAYALGEALPSLEGASRVRCHRDFTPGNWLAADDGALVVIDFEHARPDLWLADLVRLWTGPWRSQPALREAFLAGYGRDLRDDEEETLRRLAALFALSTVVWAREHGDGAFEAHGREVLRWLGLATG